MEMPVVNVDWDERKRRLVDLMEPLLVAYLYLMSVLSPIFGIVLGIVALKKCELEKNKRVGKVCVIISIVMFGVWALCIAAYVVIIVAAMAAGKGGPHF